MFTSASFECQEQYYFHTLGRVHCSWNHHHFCLWEEGLRVWPILSHWVLEVRELPRKGFPGGSTVKNLPAMQETQEMWVQSLTQEHPLEEDMATHSSILAWRIPWTKEPLGYSL